MFFFLFQSDLIESEGTLNISCTLRNWWLLLNRIHESRIPLNFISYVRIFFEQLLYLILYDKLFVIFLTVTLKYIFNPDFETIKYKQILQMFSFLCLLKGFFLKIENFYNMKQSWEKFYRNNNNNNKMMINFQSKICFISVMLLNKIR